jgi:light-regulated signal transduction histidine kinase (bacteriophytochrome)
MQPTANNPLQYKLAFTGRGPMSEIQQAQLDACERERLANSGLIQPQGALLFIDKKSGLIRYASANSEQWLGAEPSELLEQDGRQWLDDNLPELEALPRNAGKRVHLSNALDLGCGELDLVISPNSAGWLLEFEPVIEAAEDPERYRLQRPTAPIDAAKLEQLQQALVDSIRALTGYERVMLYRVPAGLVRGGHRRERGRRQGHLLRVALSGLGYPGDRAQPLCADAVSTYP